MGRRLRALVGSLKDTASLSKAATTSSSAADLAVLLATPHQPYSAPPPPRRVAALLAFGSGSRLPAAALARALAARLTSTHDAAVALKCLLAVRLSLLSGSFILRDQLILALRPTPLLRSPLHLSSFRDASSPESWALSSYVRWLARVLELLLSPSLPFSFLDPSVGSNEDYVTSLLNQDLLRELEPLVALAEETGAAPDAVGAEGSGLVAEVVRVVKEDRLTAEHEILVRVREGRDRIGSLGLADSVELACLLKRLKDCRPLDGKRTAKICLWDEVEELREMVEKVVLKKEGEERRKVRRERVGESARLGDRVILRSTRSGSVQLGGWPGETWYI